MYKITLQIDEKFAERVYIVGNALILKWQLLLKSKEFGQNVAPFITENTDASAKKLLKVNMFNTMSRQWKMPIKAFKNK